MPDIHLLSIILSNFHCLSCLFYWCDSFETLHGYYWYNEQPIVSISQFMKMKPEYHFKLENFHCDPCSNRVVIPPCACQWLWYCQPVDRAWFSQAVALEKCNTCSYGVHQLELDRCAKIHNLSDVVSKSIKIRFPTFELNWISPQKWNPRAEHKQNELKRIWIIIYTRRISKSWESGKLGKDSMNQLSAGLKWCFSSWKWHRKLLNWIAVDYVGL